MRFFSFGSGRQVDMFGDISLLELIELYEYYFSASGGYISPVLKAVNAWNKYSIFLVRIRRRWPAWRRLIWPKFTAMERRRAWRYALGRDLYEVFK